MTRRAEHRQPGPALGGMTQLEADPFAPAAEQPLCLVRDFALHRALLLLAFLAADRLVAVLDPLALVGLGRTERADLGGDLADPLAVGAADGDRGRPLAVDPHLLRDRIGDLVAV